MSGQRRSMAVSRVRRMGSGNALRRAREVGPILFRTLSGRTRRDEPEDNLTSLPRRPNAVRQCWRHGGTCPSKHGDQIEVPWRDCFPKNGCHAPASGSRSRCAVDEPHRRQAPFHLHRDRTDERPTGVSLDWNTLHIGKVLPEHRYDQGFRFVFRRRRPPLLKQALHSSCVESPRFVLGIQCPTFSYRLLIVQVKYIRTPEHTI